MAGGIDEWIGIIALIFGVGSAAVAGIVSWTKKFGQAQGKQSVTTTVIENIVKQIEDVKQEVERIRLEIVKDNIQTTRLEERLDYLKQRLADLCSKMDALVRDSRERYNRDHSGSGGGGGGNTR